MTNNSFIGLQEPLTFTALRTTVNLIVAIVILVGNLIVIASVVEFRTLRTVTNKFLVSLSVADVLSVPANVSFYTYTVFSDSVTAWKWGLLFNVFPTMLSQAMSLFTLLHIAVDRYIAVIHAVSYKRLMTSRVANVMIVSTWLYTSLVLGSIIGYYGMHAQGFLDNDRLVDIIPGYITQWVLSPHIYLALLTTCLLYARIFWVIRINSNKVGVSSQSSSSEAKTRRVTQLMATVLGILLLTWTPYAIFNSVVDLDDGAWPTYLNYIRDISIALLLTNSCVNPVLYGLKSPEFRAAYIRLLGRCFRRVRGSTSTSDGQSLNLPKTEQTPEKTLPKVTE